MNRTRPAADKRQPTQRHTCAGLSFIRIRQQKGRMTAGIPSKLSAEGLNFHSAVTGLPGIRNVLARATPLSEAQTPHKIRQIIMSLRTLRYSPHIAAGA
jgi:hypothetical protein